MAPFIYQTPDLSRYSGTIGELLLHRGDIAAQLAANIGNAQARGAELSGQAWAGAAQNIGNVIGGTIQQATDPRRQLEQQQLEANQRMMKFGSAVNNIMANLMAQNQDGSKAIDVGKAKQMLASANVPLSLQAATLKEIEGVNDSMAKFQQTRADHVADVAHGALQSIQAGADPDSALAFGVAVAKANGLATDKELQPMLDAVAGGADIKTVLTQVRGLSEKYKDVNKAVILPRPGAQLVGPSGNVLATAPPEAKAPTEAALAADAANPNSPTAAQSKAALAALQAPAMAGRDTASAAQAEAARHNAAMEAIGRMTAGREAAAQAETMRHNRATEAANNPLGMLGVGTPPPPGPPPPAPPVPPQTGAPPVPARTTVPTAQTGGPTGAALLQQLPGSIAQQVKALAEGRMQFPAGFALKSPYWQSLISLVSQYDPSFDAVNYNARSQTRKDFTSGKSAQTINALNTVAQHLDRLSTSADALNNSWSPTYNTVANFLSKQSGSKVVTNFETDKKAVVDELTRAWRQAGGSEQDIKSWANVLDAANSPDQLHGAIGEMGQLLEGKLSALENQFKQGMGSAADIPIVTPAARTVLSRLEQKASGGSSAPQNGAQQPIPGVPGGIAEFRNGKWVRVK